MSLSASAAFCGCANTARARRAASRWGSRVASRARTPSATRSRTFMAARSAAARRSSMARSAQALNHSTISTAPRGKSADAAASSIPAARAPARRAAIDQPSNGTSAKVARSRASFLAMSSIGLLLCVFRQRSEVDGIALPLLEEHQQPVVGHALRIEDAVEMVAFVLHDAGMEALDLAIDCAAVERQAAIADAAGPRHGAAQAGDRQAALPTELDGPVERRDLGIDEHRKVERRIVRPAGGTLGGDLEDDDAASDVDLRRGKAGAADIDQRLDHVGDQRLDVRSGRIGDRRRDAAQDRVPHAGYLEDRHGLNMAARPGAVKPLTPLFDDH